MSTQTINLRLVKPDLTDNADISVLNQNADKIDEAVPFKFGIENGKYGYYKGQTFKGFGTKSSLPSWISYNPFYHQNGISLVSCSFESGFELRAYEFSAGHEGFHVQMSNLIAGKPALVSFDWQFTNGGFIDVQYACGFQMINSPNTNYQNSPPNNFQRDFILHHYSTEFTPTGTIAYMRVCLSGCSDSVNNYFTLSDLEVTQ